MDKKSLPPIWHGLRLQQNALGQYILVELMLAGGQTHVKL